MLHLSHQFASRSNGATMGRSSSLLFGGMLALFAGSVSGLSVASMDDSYSYDYEPWYDDDAWYDDEGYYSYGSYGFGKCPAVPSGHSLCL